MKHRVSEAGYSMIELLMALFVGGIVIAGAYASYMVVAQQYQSSSSTGEIRDFAIPTIKIVARDLRMAGYRAVDNNIESVYGKIDTPISITDVANACCDSFFVTYDKDLNQRYRVSYSVAQRTNPVRNALFMNIMTWDGSSWALTTNQAIVADYVEDFQIVGSNNNSAGFPTKVDFNIVFRSKNKSQTPSSYTKPVYATGNHSFSITDNYSREDFEATVYLRNLLDH